MRILLVVLLLAGCSQPMADEADPVLATPEAAATTTTGTISGVVVDSTIAPIADATIAMDRGGNTTSDANGGFVINDLAPGIYFLTISADGHLPVQQSVEAIAGEVTKTRAVLSIDMKPSPFHNTVKHDGYVGYWAPGGSYVIQLLYPDETICDCEMYYEPPGNTTEFVFEAFWSASLEVPEMDQMSWELDSYVGDSLDHQEGEYAESPVYGRLAREVYSAEADNWLARMTPGISAGVYIQQKYEMFVTSFHHELGPDDWSINGAA